MKRALAGVAIALFSACSQPIPDRRPTGGACDSDRDCLFGLVCRAPADAAKRQCVFESYGKCADVADCLKGYRCRDGACTVQCVEASECAQGEKCAIGECVTFEEDRDCLVPSDCPMTDDCVAGRCVERVSMRCFRDFDCRPGERCIASECR